MLLDELKIEQDDLKVGDVVYTSHHPNIGVWVSFRYSKMRKEVIQLNAVYHAVLRMIDRNAEDICSDSIPE